MADMELVRFFNSELSALYETKPPISKAKMTSLTKYAVKAVKYYKHIVHSVEKFVQKCRSEYKVPGLYIIDSIVRQSKHQFGKERDLYGPRFAKNIKATFSHLYHCPEDEKSKIVRVLNLWQKNGVYTPDVIQPLLDMATSSNHHHRKDKADPSLSKKGGSKTEAKMGDLGDSPFDDSSDVMGNKAPVSTEYLTVLEQQRQQQDVQIQQLKKALEQQQQQQQLLQQQLQLQLLQQQKQEHLSKSGTFEQQQSQSMQFPAMNAQIPSAQPSHQMGQSEKKPSYVEAMPVPQGSQTIGPQGASELSKPAQGAALIMQKFQRMIQENSIKPAENQNVGGIPGLGFEALPKSETKGKSPGFNQALLDEFDYGDDEDDEQRLAEQRRHIFEEETRLTKSDKGSPEYKAAISNLLQKMQQTVKMPKDESVYDRLEQEPQQLPQQQQQFDQRQIPGIENRQTGISLAGQTQDLRISGSQEVPFFEDGSSRPKDSIPSSRFQPAFQQRIPGDDDHGQRVGDFSHESLPRTRESRFDRDRETKRGHDGEVRTKESRDNYGRDDKERKDYSSREREVRDRDQRDREQRDREQRDREPRARDQRDRERDHRDPTSRDRENRGRVGREKDDARDRFREKDRERPREIYRENEEQTDDATEAEEKKKGLTLEERKQLGFPDFKKGRISLCSLTIWIGHLPPRTTPEQLKEAFDEYGEVESIDLVQARGCAFVVMKKRSEADLALRSLKNQRFYGHTIRVAWAPGKAIKGSDFKQFWDEDRGVTYVPWDRMKGKSIRDLSDGSVVDPDSIPPGMTLEEPAKTEASPAAQNQIPPQTMLAPPPVPGMPLPPGLLPFPHGFPPMPGMPPPGMLPPFGMGMPPPGMPPGFAPRLPENMNQPPMFDQNVRPEGGHMEKPLEVNQPVDGEFGPSQGPVPVWGEPGSRFPRPNGPNPVFDGPRQGFDGPRPGFDGPMHRFDGPRPGFGGHPPWNQQRARFPINKHGTDKDHDSDGPMNEGKRDPTQGSSDSGQNPAALSWRNNPALIDKEDSLKQDSRPKGDSMERQETFPEDRTRERDDRERGRDRGRPWDRDRDRSDRGGRGDRGRDRARDRERDRGRDRDRDRGERDRWRGRDGGDRDRRYPDRGYDRSRGPRDRSRERARSRERDRSRERNAESEKDRDSERGRSRRSRDRSREKEPRGRDRSRDADQDRRKSRSRGNSRSKDDVETKVEGKDDNMEPDVKRKKVENSEEKKEESKPDSNDEKLAKTEGDSKVGEESQPEDKSNQEVNPDKDAGQKGGWKTVKQESSSEDKKGMKKEPEQEGVVKPVLGQGFGFGTVPKKFGSLKSGTGLAAKPSLFEEEAKPEKKLDLFSADSDDNSVGRSGATTDTNNDLTHEGGKTDTEATGNIELERNDQSEEQAASKKDIQQNAEAGTTSCIDEATNKKETSLQEHMEVDEEKQELVGNALIDAVPTEKQDTEGIAKSIVTEEGEEKTQVVPTSDLEQETVNPTDAT